MTAQDGLAVGSRSLSKNICKGCAKIPVYWLLVGLFGCWRDVANEKYIWLAAWVFWGNFLLCGISRKIGAPIRMACIGLDESERRN